MSVVVEAKEPAHARSPSDTWFRVRRAATACDGRTSRDPGRGIHQFNELHIVLQSRRPLRWRIQIAALRVDDTRQYETLRKCPHTPRTEGGSFLQGEHYSLTCDKNFRAGWGTGKGLPPPNTFFQLTFLVSLGSSGFVSNEGSVDQLILLPLYYLAAYHFEPFVVFEGVYHRNKRLA